jgi:hypothetical protein
MNCPVCDKRDRINDVALDDDLVTCGWCGHYWHKLLTPTRAYDQDYISARYDAYPTTEEMSHLRLGFVKAFAEEGTLFDVGFGNGSFIKLARKAGFEARGYDVHGIDYGVPEIHIKQAVNQHWMFVTFFDSLEHFASLDDAVSVMKRAWMVIISTPFLPENWPDSRFEWKHWRPGEHLHYFTHDSMQALFNRAGLKYVNDSDMEDVIRGKQPDGSTNIITWAAERRLKF